MTYSRQRILDPIKEVVEGFDEPKRAETAVALVRAHIKREYGWDIAGRTVERGLRYLANDFHEIRSVSVGPRRRLAYVGRSWRKSKR